MKYLHILTARLLFDQSFIRENLHHFHKYHFDGTRDANERGYVRHDNSVLP